MLRSEDGVVEVELVDFAFEGLPDSVAAGTRLTVTNSSEVELHKLSALPIPDDEDRPVEELIALPGAELAAILRVRPATVLAAGPGGPQVDEVGDGTLSEPGRYVIICAIPLGLDPDEYLDAVPSRQASPDPRWGTAALHTGHGGRARRGVTLRQVPVSGVPHKPAIRITGGVEVMGFEPTTSSMRPKRSASQSTPRYLR